MTEQSVKDFYKNMMKDIEQKFYDVPDDVIIQKLIPLFDQINKKRIKKEELKHYIERSEKIIENKNIPENIIVSIESGKNKLIEHLKIHSEILSKIEKEDYAKVVILTNMFMFEQIKDLETIEEEEDTSTNGLASLFIDLDYWIKFEQWDYVEQCARKFNKEEEVKPYISFDVPSPLEIYYNICRIS
jgi:DNA-directed RNA polymerase subunit H (RpoH/RPB5)